MKPVSTKLALFLCTLLLAELSLFMVLPVSSSPVASENTWTQKTPMQQARSHMGVAVVEDKIYAIGGFNMSGWNYGNSTETNIVSTNEEYNPATDTWTFKTPMPTSRMDFAISVWKGKIYCIGGITENGPTNINEVYDTKTDTWVNKTSLPTTRIELESKTVDNKIYLVGGKNTSDIETHLNEVYNPETDTWMTKKPLPYAVCDYASATYEGKLYIFGGGSSHKYIPFLCNLTQIYDPKNDSWRLGSSSPYLTAQAEAGATTGVKAPKRIYIIDRALYQIPSGQVYDPASDTWTQSVVFPTRRMSFSIAVVDDLLYAIGGVNISSSPFDWYNPRTFVTQYAINEQYTPFGYGTVSPTQTPLPQSGGNETPQATPAATEPAPTTPIVVASATATLAVAAGLIAYTKKRHRHPTS
jgi:N-acetylneuraminic acid mutarotase